MKYQRCMQTRTKRNGVSRIDIVEEISGIDDNSSRFSGTHTGDE